MPQDRWHHTPLAARDLATLVREGNIVLRRLDQVLNSGVVAYLDTPWTVPAPLIVGTDPGGTRDLRATTARFGGFDLSGVDITYIVNDPRYLVPVGGSFRWLIDGTEELRLNAAELRPATAGGLDLGTTLLPWGTLFLSGAATIAGQVRGGVGTSSSTARVAQTLHQANSLSTTSTTEVSLNSYSLPANALGADGQFLRVHIQGEKDSGTATLRLALGSSTILILSVLSLSSFWVDVVITRTGTSSGTAAHMFIMATTTNAAIATVPQTWSGALTLDLLGNIASTGTLQVRHWDVSYYAVAS